MEHLKTIQGAKITLGFTWPILVWLHTLLVFCDSYDIVAGCMPGHLNEVGRGQHATGVGEDKKIASHSGYVQVDWKRVEKDVNKAKRQIKKRANRAAPEISTLIEESTEFIKQNIVVSSGFVGGFLLGLAS
ncbi:FUN14 domain-containing protein 1 isoform X4 [Emys orbicularis]|uniref:FUN14 domain-containing protein 1 isoform X4 n=1 Tax=Emys orbicularis TaxID=82168 RepID=UPI0031FBA7B3